MTFSPGSPAFFYQQSAELLAERLWRLRGLPEGRSYLDIEPAALHVRKTIEGVAFAALSAADRAVGTAAFHKDRTKNVETILNSLRARKVLYLPAAADVSPVPGHPHAFKQAPERDLSVEDLKKGFALASGIVHERHPERLTDQEVEAMHDRIVAFARRLDQWLWTHTCVFPDSKNQLTMFLVQMEKVGSAGWIAEAKRIGDVPSHLASP